MQPSADSSSSEIDGDSNACADGSITIAPIEGDYTPGEFGTLQRKVGGQLETI